MAGKSITLRAIRTRDDARMPARPPPRIITGFLLPKVLLLIVLWLALPADAGAASLVGEVSASTSGGYARLIFRFPEEPDSEVHLANGILIINFKTPIEVPIDRLSAGAPDYISAARLDPDGRAVRLALKRKVTVNSMAAGEQLFVDLLPEGWTGLPPGLPQEVVENLARRAREAEKKARIQEELVRRRQLPPIRVRVGTQPTFTRYVFEMPELVAVAIDRSKDKLTLAFDGRLNFDLADAQANLPPMIASIEAKPDTDSVAVRFNFIGKIDVRTFREDNNFVVDVLPAGSKKVAELPIGARPEEPPAAGPAPRESAAKPQPGMSPAETPPAGRRPADAANLGSNAPAPAGRLPAAPATKPAAASPVVAAVPAAAAPAVEEKATAPPAVSAKPPEAVEGSDKPAAPAAGVVASESPSDRAQDRPGVSPAATVEAGPDGAAPAAPIDPAAPVMVHVRRQGDSLRLVLPFAAPTSAAVFRRADTLWLVFDAGAPIDVSQLVTQPIAAIRSAVVTRSREGQVVRIKLDRPKLTSLGADGSTWIVTIGDMMLEPTLPLTMMRSPGISKAASIVIPFDSPQQVHRLSDPEVGDTLLVVTALGPARGIVKSQSFIEFNALASTHGVVIQPLADDLDVDALPDKVVIRRPMGLVLSSAALPPPVGGRSGEAAGARRPDGDRPFLLDAQLWGFDRQGDFMLRQSQLMRAAADAPEARRPAARLELARFYLAREMFAEAKGVLDVTLATDHPGAEQAPARVLRAIAEIMLGRGTEALKDLSNPVVNNQYDAALWRAMAFAREDKWVDARAGFKSVDAAVTTMPLELQRAVLEEAARAALEVGDLADAGAKLQEFEVLGVPPALEPMVEILKGRLAEGLGRISDALAAYHAAAASSDRLAAASARLHEIALQQSIGQLSRANAISALEVLTTGWRGDEIEVETLRLLGRLYSEDGRYRDALQVMHTALATHPGSDMTRRIQEDSVNIFDSLFLGGKADRLSGIEALSLFYDFRELTPVGRRGDEMIRHLADRLVSLDLLDQAAELLQHQISHRLEGAARAQVAVRLAAIYLMSRKPDRAIEVLNDTRTGDLPSELRNQRLLLEARALSDTGRHDLALDIVSNMDGREVGRLRAHILWAARRWREEGEQIERLYGERWRDFAPLSDVERGDIMRGAIGYALADDSLGLERFKEKYAAKMAEGPDRRAFEVVTKPFGTNGAEFDEVAKIVASIDTLDGFLRDIKARFPDAIGNAAAPQSRPGTAPQTRAATASGPS